MTTPSPRAWLGPLLAPLRPAFREVVSMSLFINILALALPIFILQVYDRVVFYQGLATLEALIAGVAIAFDFILRQARARLLQRAAVRIDARLGEALFDKLISLPLRVLESRPTSYWQVLFRDVDTVRNTYCGSTAVLAADLPFVALFRGAIGYHLRHRRTDRLGHRLGGADFPSARLALGPGAPETHRR